MAAGGLGAGAAPGGWAGGRDSCCCGFWPPPADGGELLIRVLTLPAAGLVVTPPLASCLWYCCRSISNCSSGLGRAPPATSAPRPAAVNSACCLRCASTASSRRSAATPHFCSSRSTSRPQAALSHSDCRRWRLLTKLAPAGVGGDGVLQSQGGKGQVKKRVEVQNHQCERTPWQRASRVPKQQRIL